MRAERDAERARDELERVKREQAQAKTQSESANATAPAQANQNPTIIVVGDNKKEEVKSAPVAEKAEQKEPSTTVINNYYGNQVAAAQEINDKKEKVTGGKIALMITLLVLLIVPIVTLLFNYTPYGPNLATGKDGTLSMLGFEPLSMFISDGNLFGFDMAEMYRRYDVIWAEYTGLAADAGISNFILLMFDYLHFVVLIEIVSIIISVILAFFVPKYRKGVKIMLIITTLIALICAAVYFYVVYQYFAVMEVFAFNNGFKGETIGVSLEAGMSLNLFSPQMLLSGSFIALVPLLIAFILVLFCYRKKKVKKAKKNDAQPEMK